MQSSEQCDLQFYWRAKSKLLTAGLPDGINFKPKIPIWVNFVVSCDTHWCILWSILRPFGIFCGHSVFLWSFGIFVAILYFYDHLVYLSRFGILH
jgi:hypothetical protein